MALNIKKYNQMIVFSLLIGSVIVMFFLILFHEGDDRDITTNNIDIRVMRLNEINQTKNQLMTKFTKRVDELQKIYNANYTQIIKEKGKLKQLNKQNEALQIELDHYKNMYLSLKYPSISLQELNEQQFCWANMQSSSNQRKLLQYIHERQFKPNCDLNSNKYLIYDIYLEKGSGLGASMMGKLSSYFTIALQLNRTFLLSGKLDWTIDTHYCQHKMAMECYFLPLSNCNATELLLNINKTDGRMYHGGKIPTDCAFGGNDLFHNLSQCEYKIIHISQKAGKPILERPMERFSRTMFDMRLFEYYSMLTSFMMRPQVSVRNIIENKIKVSIQKSLGSSVTSNDLDPSAIISLPIRASDKCLNINNITDKKYSHRAEITCFTPLEYVLLMNAIKYFTDSQISAVILTSEDNVFLQKVVTLMKDDSVSNVTEWKVIRNTEDFSVGEGTTTYIQTIKRVNGSIDEKVGSSLETDHVVSALSSLILQTHLETEYMIYLQSSSWTKLMWYWLGTLQCNHENGQIQSKGENNKCIALITPGYIGPTNKKYVRFSKDIWQRLHEEDLQPDAFYNKFKIRIQQNGWDTWCTANK